MNIRRRKIILSSLAGIACLVLAGYGFLHKTRAIAPPYPADDEIGQMNGSDAPDFSLDTVNNFPFIGQTNRYGFSVLSPNHVALDSVHHRLFVSDTDGQRVLEYDLNNNNELISHAASHVLGNTNFTSISGGFAQNQFDGFVAALAYDATNDRLFVGDYAVGRVLVFDTSSITDGENAINVIGHTTFDNSDTPTNRNGFDGNNGFEGMAYDNVGNRLFVGDNVRNRVMVFDADPAVLVANDSGTDGPDAINVIGQVDYDTFTSGITQKNFHAPYGLAYDPNGDRLFVSDESNHRVMVFDADPAVLIADDSGTDGPDAINVLGHALYDNSDTPGSQASLDPVGLTYDAINDRLFAADFSHHRVMVFDVASITDGENAINVVCQENYTDTGFDTDQSHCPNLHGVAYDPIGGTLFVTGQTSSRVLFFNADPAVLIADDSGTDGPLAFDVLGQVSGDGETPNFTSAQGYNSENFPLSVVNERGTHFPEDTALDAAHHRLFVADTGNNRVLEFDLGSTNEFINHTADHVLGQIDMMASASATTQGGLNAPTGVAYDSSHDRLFVTDNGNNRVMVFDTSSIADGENAINVVGQEDYVSVDDGTTVNLFENPWGISYDITNDRLFVADSLNNRVMVFDADPAVLIPNDSGTDGPDAINVIGQADYTHGGAATTRKGLSDPIAVTYDVVDQRLFVADDGNNRVVVFDADSAVLIAGDTGSDNPDAINVIGQTTYTAAGSATTQDGLFSPGGLAYNTLQKELFVSDINNNRVLAFPADPSVLIANNASTDGPNATAVFGQPDFITADPNTTQAGLSSPFGLAFDSVNYRLYVADQGNSRIMLFNFLQPLSSTLANSAVGVPYDEFISSTNAHGTVSFAVTSGALPSGFSLNTSTGEISGGTPLASGSFPFSIQVTDDFSPAGSRSTSQDYTLIIRQGPHRASDALGQLDENGDPQYTASGADNTPNNQGFSTNTDVALDSVHHRLFVADQNDNRVLVFTLDSGNQFIDRNADAVLGQPDFKSTASTRTQSGLSGPKSIAYDSTTNRLFVADNGNTRVMVFDVASITDGEDAINVIGQPDFTSNIGSTTTQSRFWSLVYGVTFDDADQRLFVADNGNDRVMVFDADPAVLIPNDSGTDGPNAINVIGQSTYVDNQCDQAAQKRICFPGDIEYDSLNNRLFVTDSNAASRVMVFNVSTSVLIPNGAGNNPNAINVIGQVNYTATTGATTRNKLANSTDNGYKMGYDTANNRLFVSDTDNNRVMVYNADPTVLIPNNAGSNGPNAVNVIGQALYTTSTGGVTQTALDTPAGLVYDPDTNRLFVSDSVNNRVMIFDGDPAVLVANDSGADNPDAVDGLGQLDGIGNPVYTSSAANNSPNAQGFNNPWAVAFDDIHHRLFVADQGNFRVLEFDLDGDNNLVDRTADHVLGQANFKAHTSGTTRSTFGTIDGLAYDSVNDRLFVGDYGNSRVMVFSVASITDGEDAINVIGHTTYTDSTSGTTRSTFDSPYGVAFDPSGERLFVADEANSRVMVFNVDPSILVANNTLTDGPNAINVIGQDLFTTATSATTQDGLSGPNGLAYDDTDKRLFVADTQNWRVMVFDADPSVLIANNASTDGPNAINLLGHTAYDGSDGPTSQNGFFGHFVDYDSSHKQIFVSDENASRVLVFDADPSILIANDGGTDGPDAVAVLGQIDFTSTEPNTTQWTLSANPEGMQYDTANNRLFVADASNNRVIVYDFIQLITATVPDTTIGATYQQDLDTTNYQGTVSFSLASGSLPPGLTLGSIDGTPTTPGTYTFTIRATDDNGDLGIFFDDRTYTITVAGSAPTPAPGGGGVILPPGSSPTPTPSVSPSVSPGASVTPGATPVPSGMPAPSGVAPSPGSSPAPTSSSSPSAFTTTLSSVGSGVSAAAAAISQVLGSAIDDVIPVVAPVVAVAVAIPALAAGVVAAVTTGSPVSFAFSQSKVFLEVIGLKRRRRIWGVIYDSHTKRPVPYAKVELYDENKRLLETRYADRDGRYGFLTSPQSLHQSVITISMVPSAPQYQFPSTLVTQDSDFIVYDHLYRGGSVAIAKDTLVNYNIALDPVVSHPVPLRARTPGILSSATVILLNMAFWIGLVALPINAIRSPSLLTIGLLLLFVVANGVRITSDLYRPYGLTTDSSHQPVPYALVTLNDPQGVRKSFAVSDERGRYFLLTDPGTYQMTVYTPAQMQPPRSSSIVVNTKRGWIRRGLSV